MRDIRFRARDVVTGEILNQMYMGQCFQWVNHERQNNIVIEQFTGIKDKKGIDVYEGDITKSDEGYIFTVECLVGGPFLAKLSNSRIVQDIDGMEIIGNIHQNPELLK